MPGPAVSPRARPIVARVPSRLSPEEQGAPHRQAQVVGLGHTTNMAGRAFNKKFENLEEKIRTAVKDVSVGVSDVGKRPTDGELRQVDISVVAWRQAWWSCVLAGTAAQLKDLVTQATAGKDSEHPSQRRRHPRIHPPMSGSSDCRSVLRPSHRPQSNMTPDRNGGAPIAH